MFSGVSTGARPAATERNRRSYRVPPRRVDDYDLDLRAFAMELGNRIVQPNSIAANVSLAPDLRPELILPTSASIARCISALPRFSFRSTSNPERRNSSASERASRLVVTSGVTRD